MASKSRRKATHRHHRRAAARRLVRVEVQALKQDAPLIRRFAAALRGSDEKAAAARLALTNALVDSEVTTAFDVFGSELPDEVFAGVFDQPRERGQRPEQAKSLDR